MGSWHKDAHEGASSAETVLGTMDAAAEAWAGPSTVGNVIQAGAPGGFGSLGVMGGIGLGLSTYGLVNSINDIRENGATGENVSDTVFNGAGALAGIGTFAGGTAGALMAPALSSFAAGGTYGMAANDYAKRKGFAGTDYHGKNRSWSDMASDWAVPGRTLVAMAYSATFSASQGPV